MSVVAYSFLLVVVLSVLWLAGSALHAWISRPPEPPEPPVIVDCKACSGAGWVEAREVDATRVPYEQTELLLHFAQGVCLGCRGSGKVRL